MPQDHHELIPASNWAELPAELLHRVLLAALEQLCTPPCHPLGPDGSLTTPVPAQLPALADAAKLCWAFEACCCSWRDALATIPPPPLRVSLGRSPLPANAGVMLRRWLARHAGSLRCAALHFEASQHPGCRSSSIQQLAIDLLSSLELAATSGGCLAELAVWDFLASRPLCTLLPRFPALRSLALTGYHIDLDLKPLGQLPQLTALHVEAEALPKLRGLPSSLRHLSLACFANAARVSLPPGLLLDSLRVHCPSQPVFLGLQRALRQCRDIHVAGRKILMLLHVDGAALALAAAQPTATFVQEFQRHPRVRCLQLQAPAGQVSVKFASQSSHEAGLPHQEAEGALALAGGPAPFGVQAPPGLPLTTLDSGAVLQCAAGTAQVSATLSACAAEGCGSGSGGVEGMQQLALHKL